MRSTRGEATPKCKERADWKHKEREEGGAWGLRSRRMLFHHTLYIGYNVTNTLHNTTKAGKIVWGLAPRQFFTNKFHTTLENAPLQVSWNACRDVTRIIWLGVVKLNLPEFIWLVGCYIVIDHYSCQSLKAMIFTYLHATEAGGQAWLLKLSMW